MGGASYYLGGGGYYLHSRLELFRVLAAENHVIEPTNLAAGHTAALAFYGCRFLGNGKLSNGVSKHAFVIKGPEITPPPTHTTTTPTPQIEKRKDIKIQCWCSFKALGGWIPCGIYFKRKLKNAFNMLSRCKAFNEKQATFIPQT